MGTMARIALVAGLTAGVVSLGSHSGGIPAVLTSASGQGGSVGQNIKLGRHMAAQMGWTASNGQWQCLYTLWQGESGWSQYSDTRKSGLDPAYAAVFAYGIPQSRPATKMPKSAQPSDLGGWSNPKAQIRWGLGYIAATYRTPCGALAAKRANGNRGY